MNQEKGKPEALKNLQLLCNIGPALAKRLYSIGVKTAEQVLKSSPEKLYEKLKEKEGGKLDVCALYQLQGAVFNVPWWKCKNLIKGRINQNKVKRSNKNIKYKKGKEVKKYANNSSF